MSAYTEAQCAIKDQADLVAALEEMFGKGNVEVHESPTNLYGYTGDRRADLAHIIVRRRHVGGSSNDVGFRREADGSWTAVVSQYDTSHLRRRFEAADFTTEVKTRVGVIAAERAAKKLGRKVERIQVGRKIKLVIKG